MTSIGQKRKIEDTDLATNDKTPKQQKLIKNDNQTTDKPSNNDNKDNKKEEKEEEEEEQGEQNIDPSVLKSLKTQIEFYFGDSNYSLDAHILKKTADNNGYFPLSDLLNFKRIIEMLQNADIENKYHLNILINIISSSKKLQLNDNKDGIKRHSSLPAPPTKQDIYNRTIFAKGFHPRLSIDQLLTFWKKQTNQAQDILSVRPIKEHFTVGMGGNGKPRYVHRFLGTCSVELASVDLAEEFSKLTFNSDDRTIVCGMYNNYDDNTFEWKIGASYYPFESSKVVYIYNLPLVSTDLDIKNWIGNAIYAHKRKKESNNKIEFVYKEMNTGCCYARFSSSSSVSQCIKLLKKKDFCGVPLSIKLLNDQQAKKIWKKVAQKKSDINKNVQIKSQLKLNRKSMKSKKNNNNNNNKNDDNDDNDDDVDMDKKKNDDNVTKKENNDDVTLNDQNNDNGIDLEKFKKNLKDNDKITKDGNNKTTKNDKKHQLDDVETPDPKKQRIQ